MGVLNQEEIKRLLQNGELLRNPRLKENGEFDIEVDSYDLAAGVAVWKEPSSKGDEGNVETRHYLREPSGVPQPTVTVQPGQMIFVVTLEDVLMPSNLCGTVYSRNNIAMAGILALNAGHVDSGYEGPIVIRLINLRAIPWTLTLGFPIFTITFQTLNSTPDDSSRNNRRISQEDMLLRVRETADAALSNALYDLYASDVEKRLNEHRLDALNEFRQEMDNRWVRSELIWSVLFKSFLSKVAGGIVFLSIIAAAVFAGLIVFDVKF